jgi:GDPmannose 4,6-dehydratase
VLATNETHTVREFIEVASKRLGFDIEWQGKGVDEIGVDRISGKTILKIDPVYFRPAEVDLLIGDPSKAKKQMGWEPKVKFEELVEIMVDADLQEQSYKKGLMND